MTKKAMIAIWSWFGLPVKIFKLLKIPFWVNEKKLTTISLGSRLGKECRLVVKENGNRGGGANKLELSVT